jgi:hypothetical protein
MSVSEQTGTGAERLYLDFEGGGMAQYDAETPALLRLALDDAWALLPDRRKSACRITLGRLTVL